MMSHRSQLPLHDVFHPDNLSRTLRKQASRVVEEARSDQLALFLGAGVSKAAGLPLWGALLQDLAKQAGMDDKELTMLKALNFLDQVLCAVLWVLCFACCTCEML